MKILSYFISFILVTSFSTNLFAFENMYATKQESPPETQDEKVEIDNGNGTITTLNSDDGSKTIKNNIDDSSIEQNSDGSQTIRKDGNVTTNDSSGNQIIVFKDGSSVSNYSNGKSVTIKKRWHSNPNKY